MLHSITKLLTRSYVVVSVILIFSAVQWELRIWAALGIFVLVINLKWYKPYNRVIRLRRNGGTHTTAEWELLKIYYGRRCARCGMRGKKLTRDHILPVSKGGSDSIQNIQPLCQRCNSVKGTKIVRY